MESEERGLKGLLYNCDEPYVVEYKCNRLFWIGLADENNMEP